MSHDWEKIVSGVSKQNSNLGFLSGNLAENPKKLAVFEHPEHLLLECIPLDAERQEDYQA